MDEAKLITLDPGHFHAGLIQKEMYPGVARRVHVYAPLGPDLTDHLNRVARFNNRKENPTSWELEIHCSPDFLERMVRERPGNVVVLSGRNPAKIDRILASLEAGMHVLADKPWIIHSADLPKLEAALQMASRKHLVAYDIMTERYEITSILQRDLANDPDVLGEIVSGSEQEPGVFMESVHHIMKMVAGAPNLRPAWFFDIAQQGEGLSDVGTHLVDLAQWTLFPDQTLDYHKDVRMLGGRRWPTLLTRAQFQRVTGEAELPAYLAGNLRNGSLEYDCNNMVSYTLRGVHIKMNVLWNYEAPEGAGDSYINRFRGTRARLELRQGKEEKYKPELYVIPNSTETGPQVRRALEKKIEAWQAKYPGVAAGDVGTALRLSIPDRYRVGHEAHFAQVTNQFFRFLKNPGSEPAWEHPNMLVKYLISTRGVELGQGGRG